MTTAEQFVQIKRELEELRSLISERFDEVLDMDGAVQLTRLSKQTLYQLTSTAEIPHYKRGKRAYFRRSELEAWLTDRPVRTRKEIAVIAANLGR